MSDIDEKLKKVIYEIMSDGYFARGHPDNLTALSADKIKALFKHGVCADCSYMVKQYCEHIKSPVIHIQNEDFGCNLFEERV